VSSLTTTLEPELDMREGSGVVINALICLVWEVIVEEEFFVRRVDVECFVYGQSFPTLFD
jgi:hypothetical protein